MAFIPQYKVSKIWRAINKYCEELDCLAECVKDCNLHKAKNYLHRFTENGRQVQEGLAEVDFKRETRDFAKSKIEDLLKQVDGICKRCGVDHLEECFVNRSREALQMIAYDKILPFDPNVQQRKMDLED
ncbi:hypothetical protein [Fuchsiella alkaliacetigena]|uniref:hypothetical protein n=1 Tax=Fuchsiella alkaliacetigena TaxID=957042 RepID=UPI00200B6FC2|nr:hypothetical protein [Fuchsiella alkaliacetigena]MCK8824975.1 hypothetical protein [Fuchsiella alkaliacetigena]